MFLHIGNGKSVKKKDVIGIFDLDTATVSSITKRFINAEQLRGNVEYMDSDLPRAFVLLTENGKSKIRLSRISSTGLRQRAEEDIYTAEP